MLEPAVCLAGTIQYGSSRDVPINTINTTGQLSKHTLCSLEVKSKGSVIDLKKKKGSILTKVLNGE